MASSQDVRYVVAILRSGEEFPGVSRRHVGIRDVDVRWVQCSIVKSYDADYDRYGPSYEYSITLRSKTPKSILRVK